ncbi:MAG: hypothetical protein PHO26_05310 [Dehalococcoidia bacterium]|nr:hypothetical protein [Dehalococcoidia bacterium]MDD5495257.1 hypothetical protein [Dehalococcoidia bacterium]
MKRLQLIRALILVSVVLFSIFSGCLSENPLEKMESSMNNIRKTATAGKDLQEYMIGFKVDYATYADLNHPSYSEIKGKVESLVHILGGDGAGLMTEESSMLTVFTNIKASLTNLKNPGYSASEEAVKQINAALDQITVSEANIIKSVQEIIEEMKSLKAQLKDIKNQQPHAIKDKISYILTKEASLPGMQSDLSQKTAGLMVLGNSLKKLTQ